MFVVGRLSGTTSKGKGKGPTSILLALLSGLKFASGCVRYVVPAINMCPVTATGSGSRVDTPLVSHFTIVSVPSCAPRRGGIVFSGFTLPGMLGHVDLGTRRYVVARRTLGRIVRLCSGASKVQSLRRTTRRVTTGTLCRVRIGRIRGIRFSTRVMERLLKWD